LAYTLLEIVGASYLVYLGLGHFGIRFFGENNKNEPEDSEVTEEKLVEVETEKFLFRA
jgi:threonine/homoserine/homoserine lactone efflux protein